MFAPCAGAREVRPTEPRRWLIENRTLRGLCWGLALSFGLGACGGPSVSGTVIPTAAERTALPWKFAEVRLVRGRFVQQLAELAERNRESVVEEATELVLAATKTELDATTAALERVRAADMAPEAGLRGDCMAPVEVQLRAAQRDYNRLVEGLAPRLRTFGLAGVMATDLPERLRVLLQTRLENEARRLRDEYVRAHFVQRSTLLLATAAGMDRLCWKVSNKSDLAARFRTAQLLYNGKLLPDEVARQVWIVPPANAILRIPASGKDQDLLAPGAEFETCLYSRGGAPSAEVTAAYGMAAVAPGRSGDWTVQWQNVELLRSSAEPAATAQAAAPEEVPLTELFAEQLRALRSRSEEAQLIELLTTSAAVRKRQQVESHLVACHRAIELQRRLVDLQQAADALAAGNFADFAVRVRLQPLILQRLLDPERFDGWINEAYDLMSAQTLNIQRPALGDDFEFADLEPGAYTLLARAGIEKVAPKVWIESLQVDGPVRRDLQFATGRSSTLRAAIEEIVLVQLGLPRRRAVAAPQPSAPAPTATAASG